MSTYAQTLRKNLKLAPSFGQLPDEVLTAILELLVPQPVTLQGGTGTSLCNLNTSEWAAFFARRRDLLNLRRVSQRLGTLVEPLLYRNLVIQGPKSVAVLLCGLIRDPSLGPRIRHISSAIALGSPETAVGPYWAAWREQRVASGLGDGDLRARPNLGEDHPLRRVLTWLEESTARGLSWHFIPSVR